MPNFIVKVKQQWVQNVYVTGAIDVQNARDLAREGHGEQRDDAQFDSDIASDSWETEEVE